MPWRNSAPAPLFYGLRRRAYGVRRNSANAHDTVDEESCFLVADCYDNDPAPFILHAGGKAEPPAEVDHREHLAPERRHADDIGGSVRYRGYIPELEHLPYLLHHNHVIFAAETKRKQLDFFAGASGFWFSGFPPDEGTGSPSGFSTTGASGGAIAPVPRQQAAPPRQEEGLPRRSRRIVFSGAGPGLLLFLARSAAFFRQENVHVAVAPL